MTSLGSLPPELLIDICHDFELSDLCAIRLTCKAVALKTREYFAKHVFKIIHVAITTEGVQFLQNIATHEFRIYVQVGQTPQSHPKTLMTLKINIYDRNYGFCLISLEGTTTGQ